MTTCILSELCTVQKYILINRDGVRVMKTIYLCMYMQRMHYCDQIRHTPNA